MLASVVASALRFLVLSISLALSAFACAGSSHGRPDAADEADADASTEPDASASEGDTLCTCGCVEQREATADASCRYTYAQLWTASVHIPFSELKVRIADTLVPRVLSAKDCLSDQGGFYGADADAALERDGSVGDGADGPQELVLCPASCARLRRHGRVVFGQLCGDPLR